LHGKFFFFVAVRAMSRVAAALTTGFIVPYFFSLTRFVIYMISFSPTHLTSYLCTPLLALKFPSQLQ